MLETRSWCLASLLAGFGLVVATAVMAAEQTPEELLKSRGLTKSGFLYVLDAESDFLPKVGKLQPSYQQLKGLYDKLAAITQNQFEYDELNNQWTLVNERLGNVQAEIGAHPPLSNNLLKQSWSDLLEAEKQLRFQWNELNREVNLRYRKLVPDRERENLSNGFLKQREDFLNDSRDLRALADKIKGKYDELSKDEAIKKALGALKLSTKARLDLGPSLDFKRKSAWLISAEKATAPENFVPKRKVKVKGTTTKPKASAAPKSKRIAAPASGEPTARPN